MALYSRPMAKQAGRCASTDQRQRPGSNGNHTQIRKMSGASTTHGNHVAVPERIASRIDKSTPRIR
jgi:hypothetical protein